MNMQTRLLQLALAALVLGVMNSLATVHYVSVNSASPSPPYTNWSNAATSIQDAVDSALAGDLVLVTNGVYQTGGRLTPGYFLTNRVLVTNPITVQSVNGPGVTFIVGVQASSSKSVRCVYLTNGPTLSGFTLTNGGGWNNGQLPQDGGAGVWCSTSNTIVVSNCVLIGNSASIGGGSYQGTLINCTLTGNSATYASGGYGYGGGAYGAALNNCTLSANRAVGNGGGAYSSTLTNCTLTGNSASWGGGAFSGMLSSCTLTSNSAAIYGGGAALVTTVTNCTLIGNSAGQSGGGVFDCTLNNCLLAHNSSAQYGGGATLGSLTMNNCTLTGNSALNGGGAVSGTLNNCLLAGNSAQYGGGVYNGTLINCTLAGNSATNSGGGAYDELMTNSIIYYNSAPTGANFDSTYSTLNYCCTTPLPASGTGNITNAPLFVNAVAGNYRLQFNSPCINAGNNACVTTTNDLDGKPRISGGTVDIGAYEFQYTSNYIYTARSANGQSLILQLAGKPNATYVLQAATNLMPSVIWQPVFTNVSDTNGNWNFTVSNLTDKPTQFYRAVGH